MGVVRGERVALLTLTAELFASIGEAVGDFLAGVEAQAFLGVVEVVACFAEHAVVRLELGLRDAPWNRLELNAFVLLVHVGDSVSRLALFAGGRGFVHETVRNLVEDAFLALEGSVGFTQNTELLRVVGDASRNLILVWKDQTGSVFEVEVALTLGAGRCSGVLGTSDDTRGVWLTNELGVIEEESLEALLAEVFVEFVNDAVVHAVGSLLADALVVEESVSFAFQAFQGGLCENRTSIIFNTVLY